MSAICPLGHGRLYFGQENGVFAIFTVSNSNAIYAIIKTYYWVHENHLDAGFCTYIIYCMDNELITVCFADSLNTSWQYLANHDNK